MLQLFEARVARGDTVSAFGISMEAPRAPIPPATSETSGEATTTLIAEALRLRPGTDVLIALGELSDIGDESAVVGTGDALALAIVQATLLHINNVSVTSAVVRKATHPLTHLLDQYPTVISIGGPQANPLSATIIGVNHLTFQFRPQGIYDTLQQQLNIVEYSDDRMEGTEWAILVIAGNPRNPQGKAVVLAGYSGYGTNAAAVIFSKIEKYHELQRSSPMEALIRVGIARGKVQDPEIVAVRAIPTIEQIPAGIR